MHFGHPLEASVLEKNARRLAKVGVVPVLPSLPIVIKVGKEIIHIWSKVYRATKNWRRSSRMAKGSLTIAGVSILVTGDA